MAIKDLEIPIDVIQILSSEQAWYFNAIPNCINQNTLEILTHKMSHSLVEEIELISGHKVIATIVEEQLVLKALNKFYRKSDNQSMLKKSDNKLTVSDDFLTKIILEAKDLRSSDIHLEVFEDKCRIRIRIDGQLIERYSLQKSDYPSIVNKIKIKANLDIAEKRLPQDGRIIIKSNNGEFDIRVSVLPTLYGEKIVLRLLSRDATKLELSSLGFSDFELKSYLQGIKKTHGLVLISGPTGSGKTTSLYATLKTLNKPIVNIVTIEDPVEYTLEGINQVQLKESIGLTFASALRTFLRQDPDIIMLGEIRDPETAQMALRAALTGHLVLSTIHTNSAWGIVSRLIDMGIPPYVLSSTLNLAVAQRLVRLLCPHCKQEICIDDFSLPDGIIKRELPKVAYSPQGCDQCYYTGYSGRKAIYEVINVDAEVANEIKKASTDTENILTQKEIPSLSDNAWRLFCEGKTSFDEIYPILLSQ